MGNPSTADAFVTLVREMVLRSNDDPAADRWVTDLTLAVLRAVRLGNVAKPGVTTSVVFNDSNVGGGVGEYAIEGFLAIALGDLSYTGLPYAPYPT
ncbi:MAG: hypothetical protein ACT4QA_16460 [Panacagrimonas sp.]